MTHYFLGKLPRCNYQRTTDLLVGIPVLNRLDLLERSLASIDHPSDIVVICNSTDPRFTEGLWELAQTYRLGVIQQPRNVGVSAAWNAILRYGARNDYPLTLITANDARHHAGAIDFAIREGTKKSDSFVWHLNHYSSFILRPEAVQEVGYFDENYYPAYFEDNDFTFRCRLAGLRSLTFSETLVDHDDAMTVRSDPAYAAANRRTFWESSLKYYAAKWGGGPGEETFHSPWGKEDVDHRWWPDPRGTLDARDWDITAKTEFGSDLSLAKRYAQVCSTPSDIVEHCPILYSLAARCNHVTEFGTRTGVSTTALLFAQPKALVCYDLYRDPVVDELMRIAGRTIFSFEQQNVLEADIAPTDLLFIDTKHSFTQLSQELLRHAGKVRRFIVLHDTTTFGHVDEDGCGIGLWPAVEQFLKDASQWRVTARLENNNGLAVLERS